MKFHIENLGAVHQADIEVKPLTVFVGPNQTGKTWTSYLIGGALSKYNWSKYRDDYANRETSEDYPPIEDAIDQLLEEGSTTLDLPRFFEEYGDEYFNDLCKVFPTWLNKFMGTNKIEFGQLNVSIELDEVKEKISQAILSREYNLKMGMGKKGEGILNCSKEGNKPNIYFYTAEDQPVDKILEKLPKMAIREFIAGNIFMIIQQSLYLNTYFFPAERATLVPLLSHVKRRKVDKFGEEYHDNGKGKELSKPINDLLNIFMDALEEGAKSQREEVIKNNPELKKYTDLGLLLQKEILSGEIELPEAEADNEILFKYTKEREITLDMNIVSSMVKDLSSLVIYLLYEASPNDLLIIDEPEMNLHPEAQVKLTEFLAILVNAGINVIITTHTPYIVDHLVNLMKAATIEDKEGIKDKFYLKRTDAFISQDDVSVYLFGDNTAKSILDEEGFIDWETFSKISAHIADLYFELEGD